MLPFGGKTVGAKTRLYGTQGILSAPPPFRDKIDNGKTKGPHTLWKLFHDATAVTVALTSFTYTFFLLFCVLLWARCTTVRAY